MSANGGTLRLRVGNNGVTGPSATSETTWTGGGRGLANLKARLQAAGGQLTSCRAAGRFELAAEIPLAAARLEPAGLGGPRRHLLPPGRPPGQPGVDDPFTPGHGADGANEVPGGTVLEQVTGHPGVYRGG